MDQNEISEIATVIQETVDASMASIDAKYARELASINERIDAAFRLQQPAQAAAQQLGWFIQQDQTSGLMLPRIFKEAALRTRAASPIRKALLLGAETEMERAVAEIEAAGLHHLAVEAAEKAGIFEPAQRGLSRGEAFLIGAAAAAGAAALTAGGIALYRRYQRNKAVTGGK